MLAFLVILVVIGFIIWLKDYGHSMKLHYHYSRLCPEPHLEKTDIIFTGEELALTREQVHTILLKRFHYYVNLEPALQKRFVHRLQEFMMKKTFIIKDDKGFKDMPVLISAAAIQLCFGLKQYQLPFYKYIRIYPSEYFSEEEFLKVLAGNVQHNVITIAWNHVLSGYASSDDGRNIPLHEMSHALYIQKMVINKDYAEDFEWQYRQLNDTFKIAHSMESQGNKDHYTQYAETNLQEFWAESVELFFEKPHQLFSEYPEVFENMRLLLHQDPRNARNPLLKKNTPVFKKAGRMVNRVLDQALSGIGILIVCMSIYPG